VLLAAYQAKLISWEEAEETVETLARSSIRVTLRLVAWFKVQLAVER